jgi:hypothetical protein
VPSKKNGKGGPRDRESRQPQGTQLNLNLQDYQISFDPLAFDEFVRSQGLWITHLAATPDPRGMASRGDNRDINNLRPEDSDGFIYDEVGRFQALFTSNSTNVQNEPIGELAFSTAYMTMPRFYPKTGEQITIHPWDRFYIEDVETEVVNMQFLEARREGVDRLQYPAIKVEKLIDTDGVVYKQDVDFSITKSGDIKWLGQKRPMWNPKTGRGLVYSVRYRYTPFFIVNKLLHEIRVAQITNPRSFERSVERMPYQVQVVREHVFRDNNVDPKAPKADSRYQNAPQEAGSAGPVGLPAISNQKGSET